MAKVCVTGANGFLGSWLVRRLVSEGHHVRVLSRKSSDMSELEGLSYESFVGDILNPASLKTAFTGQDSVFHLAGLIAYKTSERPQMEAVNVEGTRNVIRAVQESNVRRLLHTSSVVAVGAGFKPQEVLNENSFYNIEHLNLGYFETKRKAEQLVIEACRDGIIDAVVVNPSTVYGPGDAKKGSRKVQVNVARGKMPFYPSGGVSIVDVEACVDGIVRAWTKGRTGERYILSGENLLIQQVFQIIAATAGVQAPSFGLPKLAIHLLGGAGDLIQKLGGKFPLSSETAWTSTLYHWFDSSKAQRELGFEPGDSKKAIEKRVLWMKEHGVLR